MKIGLIIPYKNAEKWLPRCLASIGSQPFEVYLVNDHSEDDGPLIASEGAMSSDGWHLIELDYLQLGVSMARNMGLNAALADGCDYITFLDADDELEPEAYNNYIAGIRDNLEADMIQFNHRKQTPEGMRPCRFYNPRGLYQLDNLPQLWAIVWNKVYKAELVKNIRFDHKLKHGEDELFNLDCLALTRMIYNMETVGVIHHYDNPESLSRLTDVYDLIDEQDALLQFISDHAPYYPDEEECYELLRAVRKRQVELWDNPVYKRVFGGEP